MAATQSGEDMGTGLSMAFGALSVIAALASTATAYLYAMGGDHTMQTASGLSIAAAMLFGGLAVAVLHRYA